MIRYLRLSVLTLALILAACSSPDPVVPAKPSPGRVPDAGAPLTLPVPEAPEMVGAVPGTAGMAAAAGGKRTPGATESPTVEIPAGCAERSGDPISYFNLAGGYCLRYPAGFRIGDVAPDRVVFYGPPLDPSIEPVEATLAIEVEPNTEGLALARVVDLVVESQIGDKASVTRVPALLGGEPAEVVEGLPGRVGSRQLFAAHGDRVYHLTVYPVDDVFSHAAPDVETVWQMVTGSFTFLPAGFAAAFGECTAGSSGRGSSLDLARGDCLHERESGLQRVFSRP